MRDAMTNIYSPQGLGGQTMPTALPPVLEARARLERSLAGVMNLVDSLETRLSNACRPDPPLPSSSPTPNSMPSPPRSEYFEFISEQAAKLEYLADQIETLIARIEL